jgi:hypothetical protein
MSNKLFWNWEYLFLKIFSSHGGRFTEKEKGEPEKRKSRVESLSASDASLHTLLFTPWSESLLALPPLHHLPPILSAPHPHHLRISPSSDPTLSTPTVVSISETLGFPWDVLEGFSCKLLPNLTITFWYRLLHRNRQTLHFRGEDFRSWFRVLWCRVHLIFLAGTR